MTVEGQVEGRELPEDACSLVMLTHCIPLFEVLKDPYRQELFVRHKSHCGPWGTSGRQ